MKQISKITIYLVVIIIGIISIYLCGSFTVIAENPIENEQAIVETITDPIVINKLNQKNYLKQNGTKNNDLKKTFKPIFHYSNVDISNYYNGNKVWGAITVFTVNKQIVFCLDPYIPLSPSVSASDYQNNTFSKLSEKQQRAIQKIAELALSNYQKTNNMDYLFAGQILIYQQIDPQAFNLHLNDSINRTPIQLEINQLADQLQHFDDIPSFMGRNTAKKHTLKWNSNKKEYEIYLTDTNNALNRFKQYGKHGVYTIEKINNKTIRISTKNHNAGLSPIIKERFDLISEQKSYFYQGGQSVINTNAPPVLMQMQVDIKPATGNGRLIKVTDDNQPLAGVEFGLFKDVNTTNLVKTALSNQEGEVQFNNLIPGQYYLQEISTPPGYISNQKVYPVTISPNQTTTWQTIINYRIKGQVELIKSGSYNNVINGQENPKLSGAEFTIFDKNNQEVAKLITAENGYAKSPKINYGNYTLVETKAPDGYVIDSTIYEFSITKHNQIVKINNGQPIINEGISGNAVGQKKLDYNQTINADDQENDLTAIEYTVFTEHNQQLETIHPDASGIWQTSKLKAGNYYVKETKTLPNFILDETKYQFTISEDNQVVKINNGQPIVNNLIRGRAFGQKIGVNYQGEQINLANCEFGLFQDRDGDGIYEQQIKSYISDENGSFATDWLAPGSYRIVELNAPDFYQPNYSEEFIISQNNQIVNLNNNQPIINQPIWQQIKVVKQGSNLDQETELIGLEGVEFTIYQDTNHNQRYDKKDQAISKITTNSQGIATTNLLNSSHDTYFIKETSSAPGYILDDNVYPFDFNPDAPIITIDNKLAQQTSFQFENQPLHGGFELTKLGMNANQEHVELANVGFELYRDLNHNQALDSKDQKLKTYYTNKDGKIREQNLIYGDYLLVESKQLENYQLDNRVYSFQVTKNNEIAYINHNQPIINQLVKNNFEILKTDMKTNQPLNGAEFNIYRVIDANALLPQTLNINSELIEHNQITINNQQLPVELITTIKTNYQGKGKIKNLINGTYIIAETKAPKGYQKPIKANIFKLSEATSNQTLTINLQNQKITNKVTIDKIDGDTLQQLKGAKLSLYKNNQLLKEWESSAKAQVFNLDYGNYQVCESKAPDGYRREKKCQKFSVHTDNVEQQISIKNYRLSKLSNTGLALIKNGFLILILLILLIFIRRKVN